MVMTEYSSRFIVTVIMMIAEYCGNSRNSRSNSNYKIWLTAEPLRNVAFLPQCYKDYRSPKSFRLKRQPEDNQVGTINSAGLPYRSMHAIACPRQSKYYNKECFGQARAIMPPAQGLLIG